MTTGPQNRQRPLSILQVLEPSGGGSGRHFIDLCKGLKDRGHKVTAVYSPVRAERRFMSELLGLGLARVQTIDMHRSIGLHDVRAWRHLQRVISSSGPFDVIHGHSSKAGALTRLRLRKRGAAVVYTPHAFRTMDPKLGGAGRLIFGQVERLLGIAFSDRIICVSEDEFAHALELGLPRSRLRLIVNGVNAPEHHERHSLRAQFGIEETTCLFGFVGRLSPQKAPERLIEAFAAMAKQRPEAHLLMVGSGPLEHEVRSLISALALEHRVTLTADIEGPRAMQMFDVLVMPSRYEAMSYVMLEAEASGLPMILSDVGGAGTVVQQDVNGIIIANQDDPSELAAAMLKISGEDTRSAFAAAAQAFRHRHGLDAMVEQTLSVYHELTLQDR
ncbi:glycosyltransferase family 4 protein [Peteryoungia desertarenae]|uniref:glycosyltransferase family 4 protein n=1 Tax=Peteryoungia desertarenae TaxID=1813451 RepID=UPI001FEB1FCF|nr:glycosyltransferase family 4 protein [Peteryoungia desertarenae]